MKQRRIDSNSRKAKALADKAFPDEKWEKAGERIFIAQNRGSKEVDKKNLEKEIAAARILESQGSVVYLLPENSRDTSKKVDAIADGDFMEIKTITGGLNAVQKRFLESREQSKNVFIHILSDLSRQDVINQIAGARQGKKYSRYNRFEGGKVILKIKGRETLIYLNVDNLKWKK
ncbi:MAG: hypothetical protein LBT68_03765 [Spirochaetales bacterium]|nr:hypothetical protein [Spirochaetales bacterium]